jgi:hypothetical protein
MTCQGNEMTQTTKRQCGLQELSVFLGLTTTQQPLDPCEVIMLSSNSHIRVGHPGNPMLAAAGQHAHGVLCWVGARPELQGQVYQGASC